MAVYSPLKSSIVFRLNGGTDPNGKMVVRSVTMNRIRHSVDATTLKASTDALGALFAYPVLGVEKIDVDTVEAA